MDRAKKIQIAFGRAVRKFRNAAGVSQEKLGELAGLNRTYMGDVERGERNVSIVNIYKIARALGVTLGALLGEVDRQMRGGK